MQLETMLPSGRVSGQSEFAGTGDRIGAIVYTQFLVGTGTATGRLRSANPSYPCVLGSFTGTSGLGLSNRI